MYKVYMKAQATHHNTVISLRREALKREYRTHFTDIELRGFGDDELEDGEHDGEGGGEDF